MKIEEILFLETDGSCALCGERERRALTIHHIDENHNHNSYDNRIILCHNCHIRFNNKDGISFEDIKTRKRELMYKTLTQYGINALKIAARNHFGVVALPLLLYHLVDMNYLKQEEVQMSYGNAEAQIDITARFSITKDGEELYQRWLA